MSVLYRRTCKTQHMWQISYHICVSIGSKRACKLYWHYIKIYNAVVDALVGAVAVTLIRTKMWWLTVINSLNKLMTTAGLYGNQLLMGSPEFFQPSDKSIHSSLSPLYVYNHSPQFYPMFLFDKDRSDQWVGMLLRPPLEKHMPAAAI